MRLRAALALAIVGLLAAMAPALPAGAGADAVGQADPDPALTVVAQTTWVEPRGEFRVDLLVRGEPPGARLVPRLYRPVESRDDFNQALFGQVGDLFEAAGLAPVPLDAVSVNPDGSKLASVAVAVRDGAPVEPLRINVPDPGVYPFEVTLEDDQGDPVAEPVVTFLVRLPAPTPSAEPLVTSLLVPVAAPPALEPDGSVALPDRDLDRLTTVVNALWEHRVPLTVVPGPETIDALDTSGTDGAAVVDRLADSVELRQVLASPYVDVPLSAWVEAGMDAELDAQRLRGVAVLEGRLARPDGRTWIADRDLDPGAVDQLRELGVDQLVLPPEGVEPLDEDAFPGTFTRPFDVDSGVASPLSSVVADGGLQSAFNREDPVLGAHQLLADLALVALERREDERGVVIQPPPGWVPTSGFLDIVLPGLASAPTLVEPAVIDELFDDVPPAREGGQFATSGPRLVRDLDPAPSPPLGSYPARVEDVRGLLGSFRAMTGPESRRFETFEDRILVSGAEELSGAERSAYLAGARIGLRDQFGAIDTPERQTATLTAQEGNIPFTIRSRLDYPVSVVLELSAGPRLDFPEGDRIPVVLDGASRRVNIPVRAMTSGDTPLTVTVRSPDGEGVELATTRYSVRSTAVSGIGVFLTIGAALFLVLWWFRHWRRLRARRRAESVEPEPEPAPMAPDRV